MLSSLSRSALIAAIYATLTLVLYPIGYGAIQFRLSEALTLLPLVFPEATLGLFVGCIVANLFSPNILILDVVFGSLATLLAAFVVSKMKSVWIAPLAPAVFNGLIVGAVIAYSEIGIKAGFGAAYLFNILSIGGTELAVCYIVGVPLTLAVRKVMPKRAEVASR